MESNNILLLFDQFIDQYPNDESCLKHLFYEKWEKGFHCIRCNRKKYCGGVKKYDRRCTACGYVQSPTANTLFHKVKFSLQKAFYIVYSVASQPYGIHSTDLSKSLQLRQKTVWHFIQKVKLAMEPFLHADKLNGAVEINLYPITVKNYKDQRKPSLEKKTILMAMEKKEGKINRIQGIYTDKIDKSTLTNFIQHYIDDDAVFSMDLIYQNHTKSDFSYEYIVEDEIENYFPSHADDLTPAINHWLRNIPGKNKILQKYLFEYCYRYNHHRSIEDPFQILLKRMMQRDSTIQDQFSP
ncbi:hypothetical protein [Membranihabitans marinus]|uniref:hypothetical protein n=1 Tax=Membranihabitans marinus TaxID=1227546 RepID=UPI001F17067B|nr:hypothetical protein [Membranihabitans marinus]